MDRYLPVGYRLELVGKDGEYTVDGISGIGASTVAYNVTYHDAHGQLFSRILKEYNPQYIEVSRTDDGIVSCNECDIIRFSRGEKRFKDACARQISIHNIPSLMNQTPPTDGPFEANGTLYMDVAKFTGSTYDKCIGSLTIKDRMKVCLSVSKLVKAYHDASYLCLDIKPENIFVLPETKEILQAIDFDSVKKKSDIIFGQSADYTKSWAAPEQINPFQYEEVSQVSDTYAIGELVFWSIFGRHSTTEEHRHFAVYPFASELQSADGTLLRKPVQMLFSNLFHQTIRNCLQYRYPSDEMLVAGLEEIVHELSQTTYILPVEIHQKAFFVGRNKEIQQIEQALCKDRIVVVSGLGGIGKSEVCKSYIFRNKDKYHDVLYWTYNGNLESTIAQDEYSSVAGIAQDPDEPDREYCRRKLRAIKSLLGKDSLIFLDNLDVKIDDFREKEVWQTILSLPGRLLLGSRCDEMEYTQVHIGAMHDIEDLREVFGHYCRYSDDQSAYVDQIIKSVDSHTLTLELIAKQASAAVLTPKEMIAMMRKNGFMAVGNDRVSVLKDGVSVSGSAIEHIRRIFDMSEMTRGQKESLLEISCLPVNGTRTRAFNAYYGIENHNDVNWLISHGWANATDGPEQVISAHPIISSIAIEAFKSDLSIIDEVAKRATLGLLKRERVQLTSKEHIAISDAIAQQIYSNQIKTELSALYLMRCIKKYSTYGNYRLKKEILDYAIDAYRMAKQLYQYSAVVEYVSTSYLNPLIKEGKQEDAIDLAEKHSNRAKKQHDLLMESYWNSILIELFASQRRPDFFQLRQLLRYVYEVRRLNKDVNRKHPRYTSDERLGELDYGFMVSQKKALLLRIVPSFASWWENQCVEGLFCSRLARVQIARLKQAVEWRSHIAHDRQLNESSNSNMIVIDKAKICLLEGDYEKAEQLLASIVKIYTDRDFLESSNLSQSHLLLGRLAEFQQDYPRAITEYRQYLEIEKRLFRGNGFGIRVTLGTVLVKAKNIVEAEETNMSLLDELYCADKKTRKSYLADTLTNMGAIYLLKNDPGSAQRLLNEAYDEYVSCEASDYCVTMGQARRFRKKSEIRFKGDNGEIKARYLRTALEHYRQCVTDEHPEVQWCIRELDKIK